MALEVRIENPSISTDAKEPTAEVAIEVRQPGKQKDLQIEVIPREPGKEKVSVDLTAPDDPKAN